ncbi:MAG: four helix bundle protein [Chitinophagales bacterium]
MSNDKRYLGLDRIEAYMISFKLSNYVWEIVMRWDKFAQWTVGKQYVTAIDSISANIAEGFGRYHKKDKIKFYRYSTGSLQESLDWTRKAIIRKLITKEEKEYITTELQKLPKSINILIKYTNDKLKI